jgi:hypothetical protein
MHKSLRWLSIWLLSLVIHSRARSEEERQGASFLSLGFTKSFSLHDAKSTSVNPALYWRYHSSDGWLSSLGLETRVSSSDLKSRPITTVGENFLYETRLWSSIYFGAGFELTLLYPTLSSERMFTKDNDRRTQIGVGGSAALVSHWSNVTSLEFKLVRWRGIGSRDYQGLCGVISISRLLNSNL